MVFASDLSLKMSAGSITSKEKPNNSRCSGSTRLLSSTNEGKRGGLSREDDSQEAFVFCNAKGILMIDYLWKGCTINDEFYANLLRRWQREITAAWNADKRCFVSLNVPPHNSLVAVSAIRDCGFELVDHFPPYSSDLAFSDYYLFPNMKKN